MNKLYNAVFASLLLAAPALADTCAVSLMPPFTAAQAKKICGTFGAGYIGTQANNSYVNARNAANSGNISVWKVDANDELVLNSDAGDSIVLQQGGDAQRLLTYGASSDLLQTLTFGDAGVTAVQTFAITASTADADDDGSLFVGGGGGGLTTDASRGGSILLRGNELASSGGSVSLIAGVGDGAGSAQLNLILEDSNSGVVIKDLTTGVLWTFGDAGNLTQNATNGGSIVMAKAATGLVQGEATRAANVTTATQLAVPIYISAAAAGTDLGAFIGTGATTSGPNVDFFKTRATSGAATTIVVSGDTLGQLFFYGANGTTYDPAAVIKVTSGGTPGAATDMPGKIDFLTTPDGSVTPSSALSLSAAKLATFGGGIVDVATFTAGTGVTLGLAANPADVGNTAIYDFAPSATVPQISLAQGTADTAGVLVNIYKSRATDGTADTIVASGDSVGTIKFFGSNGTTFDAAALIVAKIDATPGAATDMPGSLDFQLSPDGSATPASVFKLNNGGAAHVVKAADLVFDVGLATIATQEATAGTACSGAITANGVTPVAYSTTCWTTGSHVFLTKTSTSAVNGSCYISATSNGVSFTITCLATDTGTYGWIITHESP